MSALGRMTPRRVAGRLTRAAGRPGPSISFPADGRASSAPGLVCHVDEVMHFRNRGYVSGYAYHPAADLDLMAFRLPGSPARVVPAWRRASPDLVATYGSGAGNCRFVLEFDERDPARVRDMELIFRSTSGDFFVEGDLSSRLLERDAYHQLLAGYFASVRGLEDAHVLEIGSRNRSGIIRRDLVQQGGRYVGLDVMDGDNVDVVGDAHELSSLFEPATFDSVFSVSTFEHLAMPWKAAVEIARVLKVGGTVMVATHQTWPLHDQPWDFWRFSDHSWPALFNRRTGFEVVSSAMGEPASIVAYALHEPTLSMPNHVAQLAVAVICRKTGEPEVDWDVTVSDILATRYPE